VIEGAVLEHLFEMSIKAYVSVTRNGAFAPFVRATPQSDLWRHDHGRIVS